MPSDEGASERGPGDGMAGEATGDRTGDRGIELKGGMYTFMSLKLLTADLDVIDERLADKVQQAPGFFKDTPVVVDLTALESLVDENGEPLPPTLDGDGLLACIRKHRLVPIVISVTDKSSPLSARIALPSIEGGARRASAAEHGKPDGKPEIPRATVTSLFPNSPREGPSGGEIEYVTKPPLLIDRPIRSGQQIYARDTDLIVVGQVSPGAEVIADNNVHVYGPLRGRALCGVSGNKATRIFCQSLEAELVSVAGNYRMLETIPEELRGKPAKISLGRNDRLEIEPL